MNYNYGKRDCSPPKGWKPDTEGKALRQQTPIVIDLSTNVDLEAEIKRAKDLLREGEKIMLKLKFRGREMANTKSGFERMKKALVRLALIGRPEAAPKLIGRSLFVIVYPLH